MTWSSRYVWGTYIRSAATAAACTIFVAAATCAIEAKGTARIEQSNGTVQTYDDVDIAIVSQTLRLTSADGKGTLVITKAACSYVGELQRCLPDGLTLDQGGGAHRIDFDRGTVYVNLTDEPHALPLSSTQIAPHHILLAMSTAHGTYLSLSGRIDRLQK